MLWATAPLSTSCLALSAMPPSSPFLTSSTSLQHTQLRTGSDPSCFLNFYLWRSFKFWFRFLRTVQYRSESFFSADQWENRSTCYTSTR
jgi:hypothetical protein